MSAYVTQYEIEQLHAIVCTYIGFPKYATAESSDSNNRFE